MIPEKDNGVYRYDPDGESYGRGDSVLVPTTGAKGTRKLVKKATVTQGNHNVDEKKVGSPVGKIIGAVKRALEDMLSK